MLPKLAEHAALVSRVERFQFNRNAREESVFGLGSSVADGANIYENGRFENAVIGGKVAGQWSGCAQWVHGAADTVLPKRRRLQEAGRRPLD